jgi:hypothetical protein
MITKSLWEFDPTPYLTLPRMTVVELLTLVDALHALIPKGSWPEVKLAAQRLLTASEEAQATMIERIRDSGRFSKEDVKFDGFVDGVWGLFRDRLAGWGRYLNEGRARLAEDEELDIDLEALEARAERAAVIVELLFANGLEFLRRNYNEQSQLMANLLGVVEAEELDEELGELIGEELLPILRACQRRYEAMVNERLARDKNTTIGDLNEHRNIISRYVYLYTNAVIGTLNHAKPNTVESVETALLPIINVRLGRDALVGRRAANASVGVDTAEPGEDAEAQEIAADEP